MKFWIGLVFGIATSALANEGLSKWNGVPLAGEPDHVSGPVSVLGQGSAPNIGVDFSQDTMGIIMAARSTSGNAVVIQADDKGRVICSPEKR